MNNIIQQITDWLKGLLVLGIMNNLTNTFSSVNDQVGQIATEVGQTPSSFLPAVFNMVRNLSETVIMPIAGILLTFIACYELIQLIISYNNLASFETWFIWKWIFKTFVAVELITHTFDITMAVFDVSQSVVSRAGGIIQGSTAIDASTLATMQTTLEAMDLGPLLGIFLQSFVVQFLMYILAAIIFVIINGRMVEIYLMVSLSLPLCICYQRRCTIKRTKTVLRQYAAKNLKGAVFCDGNRIIFPVEGNKVGSFSVILEFLDIGISVQIEDADFSIVKLFGLLDPDKLLIVVAGLHAVSADMHTKGRFLRNVGRGVHFIIFPIKEGTGTGRNRCIEYLAFPDNMNGDNLGQFVVAGFFQQVDVIHNLADSFFIQVAEGIDWILSDKFCIYIVDAKYLADGEQLSGAWLCHAGFPCAD